MSRLTNVENYSNSYGSMGLSHSPSVSSINSTTSTSASVRTKFKQVPDYLCFGCELKFITTRVNTFQEVTWDLAKNAQKDGFPLLRVGEKGITHFKQTIYSLSQTFKASFNEKTGLYVHIGMLKQGKVLRYYLEDLKKICHNFIKYESCIN